MTKGLAFWILMIAVAFFGGWGRYRGDAWSYWGFGVILFFLLFLLGWHNFGFIVH